MPKPSVSTVGPLGGSLHKAHGSLLTRMNTLEQELTHQQQLLRSIATTVAGLSLKPQQQPRISAPSLSPQLGKSCRTGAAASVARFNNSASTSVNTAATSNMIPFISSLSKSSGPSRGDKSVHFLSSIDALHAAPKRPPVAPGATTAGKENPATNAADPSELTILDKTKETVVNILDKTKDAVGGIVRGIGRFVTGDDDSASEEGDSDQKGNEDDDRAVDNPLAPSGPSSGERFDGDAEVTDASHLSAASNSANTSHSHKGQKIRRVRSSVTASTVGNTDVTEQTTYHAEHPGVVCVDTLYAVLVTAATIIAINGLAEENLFEIPMLYIPVSLGLCQCFFAFWMYSRIFVRYRDNEWNVVDSSQLIKKNYMKKKFMFDLALTIPVEFIFIGWLNIVFRVLSARHIFRWLRLHSLGKCSNPLLPARSWFHFFIVFCLIVASTHGFTVLFRNLNVGVVPVFDLATNRTVMVKGAREDYVTSLFNVIATVTSVGYGDFAVHSDGVRVLLIGIMIFGVACIATFSAFATKFLTHQDLLVAEMNEKKRKMHSMLQYYGIPWELQREVISMFPSVLEMDNELNLKKCLSGLPQSVMSKIDKYLRVKLLRQTPIFEAVVSLDALRAVADVLQVVNVEAGVEIIAANTMGEEMYIIIQGVVEVSMLRGQGGVAALDASRRQKSEGRNPSLVAGGTSNGSPDRDVIVFLYPGQFFGEIALLRNTVRTATVTSVTGCQLLSLTKSNFVAIMTVFPDVFKVIEAEMEKRVIVNSLGDIVNSPMTTGDAANAALAGRSALGMSLTVSSEK